MQPQPEQLGMANQVGNGFVYDDIRDKKIARLQDTCLAVFGLILVGFFIALVLVLTLATKRWLWEWGVVFGGTTAAAIVGIFLLCAEYSKDVEEDRKSRRSETRKYRRLGQLKSQQSM